LRGHFYLVKEGLENTLYVKTRSGKRESEPERPLLPRKSSPGDHILRKNTLKWSGAGPRQTI